MTNLDVESLPPPILKEEAYARFNDNTRKRTKKKKESTVKKHEGEDDVDEKTEPVEHFSSKYMGVSYARSHLPRPWRAQIYTADGRIRNLGNYYDEVVAARVYAREKEKEAARRPNTGNSSSLHIHGGLDLSEVPTQPLILRSKPGQSMYKGVKQNKKRWEARISIAGALKTLGTFDTEEEAASVYAKAAYYLASKKK